MDSSVREGSFAFDMNGLDQALRLKQMTAASFANMNRMIDE
jgi:hypothetical protein